MIDQEAPTGTAPQPSSAMIAPDPTMPANRGTKPRRRRRQFGWLGFPSRSDAAQHLRMIGKHFLSLSGFRP